MPEISATPQAPPSQQAATTSQVSASDPASASPQAPASDPTSVTPKGSINDQDSANLQAPANDQGSGGQSAWEQELIETGCERGDFHEAKTVSVPDPESVSGSKDMFMEAYTTYSCPGDAGPVGNPALADDTHRYACAAPTSGRRGGCWAPMIGRPKGEEGEAEEQEDGQTEGRPTVAKIREAEPNEEDAQARGQSGETQEQEAQAKGQQAEQPEQQDEQAQTDTKATEKEGYGCSASRG
jgi:hypothetical protein